MHVMDNSLFLRACGYLYLHCYLLYTGGTQAAYGETEYRGAVMINYDSYTIPAGGKPLSTRLKIENAPCIQKLGLMMTAFHICWVLLCRLPTAFLVKGWQ